MKLLNTIIAWDLVALALVGMTFLVKGKTHPADFAFFRPAERAISSGYVNKKVRYQHETIVATSSKLDAIDNTAATRPDRELFSYAAHTIK